MPPDAPSLIPCSDGADAGPVPPVRVTPVLVEKRSPSGRLLARVGVANGMLEGTCIFFAEDGETVVAETLFRDGRPVVIPPATIGAPVASADSLF
ncbi:hypothetical protein [Azospirillum sp. TSO35-2]|uniref:hypothetical protein n=1 Tax=Azospirillum sp. TSO35-2 TaxID=716796 RepID=UPI000D606D0B|nr:hypothetical protein [Azospirillum sp. TSO35-2]PWC37550.1 hypothetical protein TSO352_08380 [Azospirillum sp. TSO35-2]